MESRHYSISVTAKDDRMVKVCCLQRANHQFCPTIIISFKSIEQKIQVDFTALEHFAWKVCCMKKEEDRMAIGEKLEILFNIALCIY